MNLNSIHILKNYLNTRKLTTLVENRTIYSAKYSELNIFETNKIEEQVHLTFSYPIIASMLEGKKIMHLDNKASFEFVPGESVIIPKNKELVIDFPEATIETPTTCMALVIDPFNISETVQQFNENIAIENDNYNHWNLDDTSSHLYHTNGLNYLIKRIIKAFTGNNKSKDIFIDLMLKELIGRLLQTKAKKSIINAAADLINNNRIAYVVNHIKGNFKRQLSIKRLSDLSYLSSSQFHKVFKDTMGETPIDYINSERIEFAKKQMLSTNHQISRIAFESGFNSVSYFNRQFKKHEKITPKQYKDMMRG